MPATQSTFVDGMEIYRNFTRPIIYDSISAILKYFKLDGAKNIYYPGDGEITRIVGSDFASNPNQQLYTDGIFRNKVYIVPTINPSPFNSGYHNQRRERTEAYFHFDSSFNMGFYPEFRGCQITVEVVTHHTSRIAAQNFVNRINLTRDSLLTDFTFDPIGHLPVNNGILEFYSDFHQLLVKNQIRTDDWYTYFKEKTVRDFTIIQNEAGNHKTLVYPVKIRDIMVQFDEPDIRLAQKGEIFGQYEVGFSYTFFHNEFTGWRFDYPLSVHQDQIPDKWVVTRRELFEESMPYHGAAAPEYVAAVRMTTDTRLTQAPFYLVLPNHDNWERPHRDYVSKIIQCRLKTTNEAGEQLLCNLFEIPNFIWSDNAKAYILRHCDNAFLHHYTPFLFEIYSEDLLVAPSQCRMDETGNIYMTRTPTDFRNQRLIVNIDYDVANYENNIWDDPDILMDIFPWWDWDNFPEDWREQLPGILPFDSKPRWNNYEMVLGLIVKNINEYVRT